MPREKTHVERPAKANAVKPPRGIQSATVALKIVQVMAEADAPLQLHEIASATGMPPSNVHRYLVSFGAGGLTTQDPVSSRYDLGPLATQLGLAAIRRIDGVSIANEVLMAAVVTTGMDGHLAVWGTAGPTVLRWRGGLRQVTIRVSEGTVLPLLTSATGRLWAAYRGGTDPAKSLSKEIAAEASRVGKSFEALAKHYTKLLADIRREGVSFSSQEQHLGTDALCVPILDRDGMPAFTVTLLGATSEPNLLNGPVRKALAGHAETGSRRLGWGGARA